MEEIMLLDQSSLLPQPHLQVSKRQNHMPKSRPHQQCHESVCGKSHSFCSSYKGRNCPPCSPAENRAHLVETQLKKRRVPQHVPSPPAASGEGVRTGRKGLVRGVHFSPQSTPKVAPCAHPVSRGSCTRSKASRAVGTKVWSTAAGQSPHNFTCENLPEAGPGVRALIMNTRQKQVLRWLGGPEGRQQPLQASDSSCLQEAAHRKKISFGPVCYNSAKLTGVGALRVLKSC